MTYEERKKEKELIASIERFFISKFLVGYICLLSLILFFEFVMIVRGIFVFDFTYWRHLAYFFSYIVLVICSIPVLAILIQSYRKGHVLESAPFAATAYVVALMVWGAMISYLDMVGNHTLIVYLTIIMGVGAMIVINPKVYAAVVSALSVLLISMCYVWGSSMVRTTGYLLNFIIFVSISIMITVRQFSATKREYLDRNKLEEMSFHDVLSGLKNRNALIEDLKTFPENFSFGVIDVDDFKSLNDLNGHDYGDNCIKVVGKSLKNHFGENVYRYGGDEFIVVSQRSNEEIQIEFDKVNDILSIRFQHRDVSISGGFTRSNSSSEVFDDYFKRADKALYKAKTNGKHQVVIE